MDKEIAVKAVEKNIDQKMDKLKQDRKAKMDEIGKKYYKKEGEEVMKTEVDDLYKIEDKKLTREEIDELYSEAKNVKQDEQENPNFDVSELKNNERARELQGKKINFIEEDLNEKLLYLENLGTLKKGKIDSSAKHNYFIGEALQNGRIEVGKSIELGTGNTSNVSEILLDDSGSYVIITENNHVYKLVTEEMSPSMKKQRQKTLKKEKEDKSASEGAKETVDDLGGKEFKAEENKAPEEKEKTAQERKEEIEKLKEEVEKRRKDYLDADYERKKAYKRIGSFFGKLFKDKQEKNLENDEEIAWYRAHYDDSLMQYKDARLEDARKNGASDKELLDIAKEFQLEANVNVADGVTQVKVENQEGRFSGFIKEHSKKIVEEYKKMSLTKKIAIGAAFGVAGVGSVYIGGVAVGIVGSAIAARRALLAVVTGTTVSLTAEAMGKKATDKKIEKEIGNLEKEISGLNEEEKFKLITEFINKDIEDKNNKIDKIKNKNLRHLAYGMGAAIGTMILPKVTRMFSESTGASAWVKEHILGKMKAPNNLDMMEKSFPGEDKVPTSSYEKGSSYFSDQEGTETGKSAFDASETEKPMVTNVPEEDLQGKTPEVETETEVTLEVQKGSSLEGSLINYLNENPNLVERYNEFNGGKKFDVGQIAHRMALEYAEKNSEIFPQGPPSLIQEGSEISINTETMEIESIKNEKGIDYISKENSSGASTGEDVKIETNVEEKPFEKKSFPPNSERLEDPVIEMKSEVGPQEGQEAEIEMKSDSPVTDGQDTKTKMNIENESIIRDKVIDLFKSEGFDSGNQKVDTMMYLSDGSNQVWRNIKDLEFSKVGKNPNFDGEIEGKVMKRIKNLYETAGKELRPKKGEKIVTWVSHISEKTEV